MDFKLDPDIKAMWTSALRSGDYPQGRNYLKSKDGTYCCLGVLGCLLPGGLDENRPGGASDTDYLKESIIPHSVQYRLSGMNDGSALKGCPTAKSFLEIADYIEANL